MSIDERLGRRMATSVSRRTFMRYLVTWGGATGAALSGLGPLLRTSAAWAVPSCSQVTSSSVCDCTHSCTTNYCSGCNGGEQSDGCPGGYNQTSACGYPAPSCWCSKICCVQIGSTFQRRRRLCCDCKNANNANDLCTCRGPWQYLGKCGTAQWTADGSIVAP
jgi:hypothetical protein